MKGIQFFFIKKIINFSDSRDNFFLLMHIFAYYGIQHPKTQLHMPEYGRIIQQLVERCKELPSRDERNEMAMAIIDFMGQRNPQLRDEENYKHKLWDHLLFLPIMIWM